MHLRRARPRPDMVVQNVRYGKHVQVVAMWLGGLAFRAVCRVALGTLEFCVTWLPGEVETTPFSSYSQQHMPPQSLRGLLTLASLTPRKADGRSPWRHVILHLVVGEYCLCVCYGCNTTLTFAGSQY
jgi:hypothetical protein